MVPTKLNHRAWKDAWAGATVCILGSGPSVTPDLLEIVRGLKDRHQTPVIAVNSSFISARWADIVFFSNRSWWNYYQLPVRRSFPGRAVSVVNAADPRVTTFRSQVFRTYDNSGADAIGLALYMGAKKVLLAGFDGPRITPLRHHAEHPPTISSLCPPEHWDAALREVLDYAAKQRAEVYHISGPSGYPGITELSADVLADSSLYPSQAVPRSHPQSPDPISVQAVLAGASKERLKATPETLRLATWGGRWSGKTVFVLASGPSLTETDVARVQRYSEQYQCPVVVTNTTFKLAPWADLLFFHDRKWWDIHGAEVGDAFSGLCVTMSSLSTSRVLSLAGTGFKAYRNSGGGAINFAMLAGAKRIITLGLDGKYASDGRRHWHIQHPKLGDAASLPRFVKIFPQLAQDAKSKGVEIINASRDTALICFPRVTLENVLSSPPA